MDLEILINDTLINNKFVDIDDVRHSISKLYPDFNIDQLDTFNTYIITNNLIDCKKHKWSQYFKIQSHYKDGIGSLDAIEYMSTFDLYCQMNGLYKFGNYYY
jgi:hypothetical protein